MLSPVKIWRSQKKIRSLIQKRGTIVSWTLVRVPPGNFVNQAPYPVVLVALEDGYRIMAQLVDYQESSLQIGQHVVTVIRRIIEPNTDGVIPYGIKVKPIQREMKT